VVLPCQLLHAGDPKKGVLTVNFELSIEGQEKGMKFVFPMPARADAPVIAAALNGTGHAGE